jgi:hypothetical protein
VIGWSSSPRSCRCYCHTCTSTAVAAAGRCPLRWSYWPQCFWGPSWPPLVSTRTSPCPISFQYTLNADTGQASWLSAGERPDAWTAQFFADGYTTTTAAFSPGYYFEQQRPVITAAAPRINLPAPTLTVVENKQQVDIKTVRLRVASPRGAPYAHLDLRLPGDLTEATVNGRPVTVADIPTNRRQRFTLLISVYPHRVPR